MEDNAAQPASTLIKAARPALIAGIVIAVVCIGLLIIIFALDSFNAATYSVAGKSVNDATDEARGIRELYSAARTGGIITLVVSGVVAVAAAVVLYLNRGNAALDEDDDGQDYDLEDLTGR
ncbi:hypothetical protein [Paenarthrobacter aurescens]|uniref:Uncharacterized protein n=1 Tax=Paenarthrobacter aurescens TaxID=43663 RepID=A0A4Y3NBT4_PAEAU|nr:hypothetical protein [Paenarthrobacter aurescens]MDO6144285.1 hypothetical protein [Paenarthrobacter aurescens]MDO6148132.1 hypothetical protein [Paenarthrobacter aurescens]MDO6159376.1 hypothetical protein [Paenarthrobacter aurescens]MDO6163359.1 hypothetical protein [Paenarthrobacter aurescens]GEB17845.1 hypothetical protein AAU01_06000 [Paenarthrobacter aurescens]